MVTDLTDEQLRDAIHRAASTEWAVRTADSPSWAPTTRRVCGGGRFRTFGEARVAARERLEMLRSEQARRGL